MTRSLLERLAQDLRYAARRLGRDRGFTVAATLILAVGIGACTAMFSIVHAVLLRPFAVRSPERIVMLWSVDTRHQAVGELTYSARRDLLGADAVVRGHRARGLGQLVRDAEDPGADPVALSSSAVSGHLLRRARCIGAARTHVHTQRRRAVGAPVMVLSHATWTQYFGADPTASSAARCR